MLATICTKVTFGLLLCTVAAGEPPHFWGAQKMVLLYDVSTYSIKVSPNEP